LFDASRHPFILTPGDNDWTDCHQVQARIVDPLERLARLRTVFFSNAETLGQRRLTLALQSADITFSKFVENRTWTRGGVVFVTLHIVGSNNNYGRTPEMDAEFAERNAANLQWMANAFGRARTEQAPAIVIFMQANPFPFPLPDTGFVDFVAALKREVRAFPRPVLLVHGDTHFYRVDNPLDEPKEPPTFKNFTRLETFGHPAVGWVRVAVDPSRPGIFTFKPEGPAQ
jgi:hypothetical protein